jgi:hypothetical protein
MRAEETANRSVVLSPGFAAARWRLSDRSLSSMDNRRADRARVLMGRQEKAAVLSGESSINEFGSSPG